jgi:hypothetical protein
MPELRFLENAALPRLAWCARVGPAPEEPVVEHGPWVETGKGYFIEGVFKGDFGADSFRTSEIMLGSGGALHDGHLWFTPTTHSMERLFSVALGTTVFVSNSLPYLLAATDSRLDRRNWSYEFRLMTFLLGLGKATTRLPLAHGRTLSVHYHCSFCFDDGAREPRTLTPPAPPRFGSYVEYIDYLTATLARLNENATSPRRRTRYAPLATLSSGYDSPACAVLAKTIGCRRAVTFSDARQLFERRLASTNDSGIEIARYLGLEIAAFGREDYLAASNFPEAAFLATGGGGDDVVLAPLGERLAGSMLFTGMLGDTLWSTRSQDPAASERYRFRFPAGGSLQEFRVQTGFVHVPVPLLTFARHREIERISRSAEMSAWRVGGDYDRPIPRRLLEEHGVPRGAFASEKRAITQPFWRQRASARCMSRASLADFERFRAETAAHFPLGKPQMDLVRNARRAYYKVHRLLASVRRDPYAPTAHLAAATTEPLRFHWAVAKVLGKYEAARIGQRTPSRRGRA